MRRLENRFAAIIGALMLMLCLGVETSYAKSVTVTGVVSVDMAREELGLINNERANAGLSPLEMSPSLQEVAMLRAAEISVSFSHTHPNGLSCMSAFPSECPYPYGRT